MSHVSSTKREIPLPLPADQRWRSGDAGPHPRGSLPPGRAPDDPVTGFFELSERAGDVGHLDDRQVIQPRLPTL